MYLNKRNGKNETKKIKFISILLVLLFAFSIVYLGFVDKGDLKRLDILRIIASVILACFIILGFLGIVISMVNDFKKDSWKAYAVVGYIRMIVLSVFVIMNKLNPIAILIDFILISISLWLMFKIALKLNSFGEINLFRSVAIYIVSILCFLNIAGITGILIIALKIV